MERAIIIITGQLKWLVNNCFEQPLCHFGQKLANSWLLYCALDNISCGLLWCGLSVSSCFPSDIITGEGGPFIRGQLLHRYISPTLLLVQSVFLWSPTLPSPRVTDCNNQTVYLAPYIIPYVGYISILHQIWDRLRCTQVIFDTSQLVSPFVSVQFHQHGL